MNLIQEYLDLAEVCASIDYSDKNSVQRHNKSVPRLYEIAEKIGSEQTSETVADCIKLLDIHRNKRNIWAALHIPERIPADKPTEQEALAIIKQIAGRRHLPVT